MNLLHTLYRTYQLVDRRKEPMMKHIELSYGNDGDV